MLYHCEIICWMCASLNVVYIMYSLAHLAICQFYEMVHGMYYVIFNQEHIY